jgi:tripartite-type tricarboxylate transporter receptor subunit TctC
MKNGNLFRLAMLIGLIFVAGVSATASAEDFYKGKTIRIVVGFSPGGGFDTYTRVIARHMKKYIPGNPSMMVQNMTGAGSLIAANYIYNKGKPDGLTIGNWIGGLMMQQVFGNKAVKFNARNFEWLGTAVQGTGACAFPVRTGITSLDRWRGAKAPVKIAGEAPGSSTYNMPRVLQETLKLPTKIIQGYRGTAKIRLAVESGEAAGACWTWESMKSTWRKALESGEVKVIIQAGRTRHKDLPDVPNAIELAKSDEARRLIEAGLNNVDVINRGYSLPPGTPKDRVRILQKAFMATMEDPAFLEETKKAKLDLTPLSGPDLKKMVAQIFEMDPALVSKLREMLVPKG